MNSLKLSDIIIHLKQTFELQSKMAVSTKESIELFERALARQLMDILPTTVVKGDLNDY
jgi:hypothetical protein